MMKKYKWSLLLGSLLSLSPILIGLLLWNQLPAKLPTHFSTGNTPDGWSSKAITVFGLPLFMLRSVIGSMTIRQSMPLGYKGLLLWKIFLIPI